MYKGKAYKLSSKEVSLSSVGILEKMEQEYKQLSKAAKAKAADATRILAKANRDIGNKPREMEAAADSFIKSAKAIGLKSDDWLIAEVVKKYADNLRDLQNALTRAAVGVKNEI